MYKILKSVLTFSTLVLSLWSIGQDSILAKNSKHIKLTLTQKIKVSDGVLNKLRIITLIPNDIKNRQTINSFGFNINPDSIKYDQSNAYAIFYLYNVDADFDLTLTADITIYRHISTINTDTAVDFSNYLKAEKFVETKSLNIKRVADTLKKNNDIETIIATYNFVNQHISYEKNQTIGAEEVLESGVGKCADFSDLFVALLRANNIPAKIVKGLTTDASDNKTFHQWAEAYTKSNGWILFDPTTKHMSIRKEGTEYKLMQKNKYVILSQKGFDDMLEKAGNSFSFVRWRCTTGTQVKRKVKFYVEELD